MRIALISVTDSGGKIACKIAGKLNEKQFKCKHYCFYKYPQQNAEIFENLPLLIAEIFNKQEALIFVSACAIAVRSIAPHICSKCTDPAVIVVDEQGKFAVSLLSGHIGGANNLTKIISQEIGAKAVITTATDVGGTFSVDSFAKANNLHITDMKIAKEISSAVLRDEKIGFFSDYKCVNLPHELTNDLTESLGICISDDENRKPFACTLNLIPQKYTLGIGCKKGTNYKVIEEHIIKIMKNNNIPLNSISAVATIDIKQGEVGLIDFCEQHRLPLFFYTSDELMSVDGDFTTSEFVQKTTGADNVCERSAILQSGGRIVAKKTGQNGVTVAVAEREINIDFEKEML